MKPIRWRTTVTGAIYVCSKIGSDLFGDGTQANPYESLRRAWESNTTKPANIVCRGYFCEDMGDGNHVCNIRGDYMGAAVFDGADTYLIYGFGHINMVIVNCAPGNPEVVVNTGSWLLAGVGRANIASSVGDASRVLGVAGSPVVMDRTGLYMGVAGGITAVSYCVFSRIRNNSSYPVSLGSQAADMGQHNTFYGVPIAQRRKRLTQLAFTLYSSIFAAWDMFADDAGITFNTCLIAADCKWYYNGVEIPITGATSDARQASLIAGMDAAGVPSASRPVFVDCLFSPQTSSQLFNNPEKIDFTLIPGSDACIVPGVYYGALPPALNVPIMDESSGVPATWDEQSAAGCVTVASNAICIDDTSLDLNGEILSKIITINPSDVNINGVFANFATKFSGYNAALNTQVITGVEYSAGESLPVGRYIVKGTVVYNDQNVGDNAIVVALTTGTTFADSATGSKLIAIEQPNVDDVVYMRETPMPYATVLATDGLQAGGVYLNTGAENITYRGRTIVPHESFVAQNSVDTFTALAGYRLGVMFDDTRIPSVPWIPCQLWGEYFVWRASGVVQTDTDGIPVSSGNYLSYQTSANGGYSNLLMKSIMNRAYFQFKVAVKKYR